MLLSKYHFYHDQLTVIFFRKSRFWSICKAWIASSSDNFGFLQLRISDAPALLSSCFKATSVRLLYTVFILNSLSLLIN